MNKTLNIKIKVDKDTGAVKLVGNEFDTLNTKTKTASAGISDIGANLAKLAFGVGTIYSIKEALEFAVKSGFSFNNSLEQSVQGLTSLTVATSSNTSALGKHLNITQKYSLAAIEATQTVKDLQKINAETPHTLNQTNQIYKAMYVSMKNLGASNTQMINITKKMSIAAGSAGIEFNSLLAGVDGLATGTVLANSDLGRFLSGLGLTNEVLKESDDVVKLLEDRLSQFKAADTMNVSVSNLSNSWDQLSGTLTEDMFEDVKSGANSFSKYLDTLNIKLIDYKNNIESIQDIHRQSSVDVLKDELKELDKELQDAQSSSAMFWNKFSTHDEARIQKILMLIKTTERKIKSLENNVSDSLVGNNSDNKDSTNNTDKTVKLNIKTYMDDPAKEFYTMQDKLSTIEQKLNITIADDPIYEVKQKYANLKDEVEANPLHTQVQLDLVDDALQSEITAINDKKIKIQADIEIKSALEDIDQESDAFNTMLDGQIALIDATNTWNNSLEGTANTIGNVMGAMSNMAKADLVDKKNQIEIDEDLAKARVKFGEDSIEFAEAENKYIMESSDNKVAAKEAEMGAYSSLAGAMVGAYEQGSSAALAFSVIQAATGIASSWTAIANAWSMPYPSNIPAVAMVAANVLPIIGQLGGGGGGSAPTSISADTIQKSEYTADLAEITLQPLIDIGEKQIELLEKIGFEGTASKYALDQSKTQYTLDMSSLVEEIIQSTQTQAMRLDTMSTADYVWKNSYDAINQALGENLYTREDSYTYNTSTGEETFKESTFQFDADVFRNNALQAMGLILEEELSSRLSDWRDAVDAGASAQEEIIAWQKAQGMSNLYALQEITYDYLLTVSDVVDGMSDSKDDMKTIYDELTGTTAYATRDLVSAFEDINNLVGSTNSDDLANYLTNRIDEIEKVEEFLTDSTKELFLSKDLKDIEAQTEKLEELRTVTGLAFEEGIESVQNYMDSIELVAEAMITSNENSKSWEDSFKTSSELAEDLAKSLGYELVGSFEELDSIYLQIKNSTEGVTDASLEMLEAQKAMIETSKINTSTLLDGFRDIGDLAQISASALGVTLPESANVFFEQFETMRNDAEGLTDIELSYFQDAQTYLEEKYVTEMALQEEARQSKISGEIDVMEAQKDSVQAQIDGYDELTSSVEANMSEIKSIISTIDGLVNNLRGASTSSSYTLDMYKRSIDEAYALRNTNDYEALNEAITNVSTYSSAMFKESNFSSAMDMELAQAIAANKLEGIEDVSVTQLDKLTEIVDNTGDTVSILTAQLSAISTNISNSNSSLSSSVSNSYSDLTDFVANNYNNSNVATTTQESSANNYNNSNVATTTPVLSDNYSTINSAYDKALGRDASDEGINYWESRYTEGSVSDSNILSNVLRGGVASGEVGRFDMIQAIYKYGLGREATREGMNYWMVQNQTDTIDLYNAIKRGAEVSGETFNSFDVGTSFVPQDQFAHIHRGEIITPPAMSDDIRAGHLSLGNNNALIEEIKSLKAEIVEQKEALNKMAEKIENIDDRDDRIYRESKIA